MKRFATFFVILTIALLWSQTLRQTESAGSAAADLPSLTYLGEGVATYTVEEGKNFIVKRADEFRFDFVPGPTYTAAAGERVWQSMNTNAAPPAEFHAWVELGAVTTGCAVEYIGVDDDVDGRINHFYLGDTIVHTVTEGMVFSGQFSVPADGQLRFYAEDSVGGYLSACESQDTPTPEPTATESPEPTMTASPTSTPLATNTPTATQSPTPTSEATVTATVESSATPTITATANTPEPSATVTATQSPTPEPTATEGIPDVTPTPTKEPRKNACLRINFEISGDHAHPGTFVVKEVGGRLLASWHAEEGWQDSGWIQDIDITYPSVFVEVFFVSDFGGEPIKMHILNPAPGTKYGWLSRGVCHALEVGWPENMPELPTPDPNATTNPVFEDGSDNNSSPIPPPLPTPTSKGSSSLS
ncbi:MAG: hypothetical protein KDE48_19140 [Anaerolineales bacterium]|nr:hypothetical protein [Anaerolineales bacterium]